MSFVYVVLIIKNLQCFGLNCHVFSLKMNRIKQISFNVRNHGRIIYKYCFCSKNFGQSFFQVKRNFQQINTVLAKVNFVENAKIDQLKSKLVDQLKLSAEMANIVCLKLNHKNLDELNEIKIDDSISLLLTHFSLVDIHHNIGVLTLSYEEIYNKIIILKELGFENLQIKLMNALPYLMERTLSDLKTIGVYPVDTNPYLTLFKLLDSMGTLPIISNKTYSDTFGDNIESLTIKEIRQKTFYIILKQMLNCSEHMATHIVENLSSHPNFFNTSFTKMISNLNLFIEVINLPINYLIKNFRSLTTGSVENMKKLSQIKKFEENKTLRIAFFSRVTLIKIKAEKIEKRLSLLIDKFHCSTDQLLNCIFILELPCNQIEENFKKFQSFDCLHGYEKDLNFLRLIINIDMVIMNIIALRERDISPKYVTLKNLLSSNTSFLKMVNNHNFKLTLNLFTQLHFNCSIKEIRSKIGIFKTNARTLNSFNAESVVNYFRSNGLTDEQIINGIYLIYFDLDLIKSVWERLFHLKQVEQSNINWKTHPNVLQLLFYFLERDDKNCL